jgi:hypothetical protein
MVDDLDHSLLLMTDGELTKGVCFGHLSDHGTDRNACFCDRVLRITNRGALVEQEADWKLVGGV